MLHKLMHLIWICGLLCIAQGANAAEITHEKLKDGGLIAIEGSITSSDLEKFRQISVGYRKAIVVLNSDGGALMPAIEIGKIIKIAGFVTLVPEGAVCASSCALIWLAGETRFLSPDGHVGFHASYRDNNGKLEESGVANALIGNYLTKLNFPEKAVIFATTAPPDEIMWLTEGNKTAAGIDFEEFGISKKTTTSAGASVSTVVPPPIQVTPRQSFSTLPSSLPSALSRSNSQWVKFAGNAFYDAKSILLVEDIRGRRAGRKFWAVMDYSKDPKSKNIYSMIQYFVYCPDETVSIYNWTDYKKNGQTKARDISSRPMPSPPGSAERTLVAQVCR